MSNIIELSPRIAAREPSGVLPPENVGEVKALPYSVTRRIHSRKPRRSKNGTPEERAAAAAPPSATVTQLPRPRGSMLYHEFRAKLEELDESGRQFINGYMQALLDQRGLR
jgi:hypothetical protein